MFMHTHTCTHTHKRVVQGTTPRANKKMKNTHTHTQGPCHHLWNVLTINSEIKIQHLRRWHNSNPQPSTLPPTPTTRPPPSFGHVCVASSSSLSVKKGGNILDQWAKRGTGRQAQTEPSHFFLSSRRIHDGDADRKSLCLSTNKEKQKCDIWATITAKTEKTHFEASPDVLGILIR